MSNFFADFFAADYKGGAFVFLGPAHLAALGTLVLLNLLLLRFKHASDGTKNTVRWVMALTLWINEFAWHYWNYSTGQWTIQTMLPLHLCSVLVWVGAWMLVTKNYRVYEFMYFMGISGALQALATPDVGIYGYPHFRFFQTFISHGLIVTAAIYMTTVEGFRPTWKSIPRVFVWTNVYAVIVYFINSAIGSNFLMINHKPYTPSVLDLLPDWPIYIIYMELMGIACMLLLYLPFAIKDMWTRHLMNRDNDSRLESVSK
ncbi:MAG TPA: TIGR02206 family membrane protein [Anaerolineales bacterium]|nr:TIGR02206 family membrane protein [Anaerolineales bacterium]